MSREKVVDIEVESDEVYGRKGRWFLAVRRLGLRNVYADGGRSEPYTCDFLVRSIGVDAVVVALYHRGPGGVEVLLRDGLRPALRLGRDDAPIDEPRALFLREAVAGVVEPQDLGADGIRRRAAAEALEEAGYAIDPAAVEFLGAGTFPTAGSMPEKFHLVCAEVVDPRAQGELDGDGSPMEEGASTVWIALDEAIAMCARGELIDMKTEVVLRRLRDKLG